MPAMSSASPLSPAVQVRREMEAVEDVERRADDERVEGGADARPLAERGREHEHDEGHHHHRDPEAQARVDRDGLVQDVPRAEPDIGAHGQQLAPAVEQQRGDQRGEARAHAAAQGRMRARHLTIMAVQDGDMLKQQARQPRGPCGREESPDTEGQGAG